MLNWSQIVQRIKDELGHPFQPIEKSDEKIIDYLKTNALQKFEDYFPDKYRISIDCSDKRIQVPGRISEFYIIDPDGREVKSIVSLITGMSTSVMNGHPILGPFSGGQALEEWALQSMQAGMLSTFSNFNYTTEFYPPNSFRISPRYTGQCVVEYERSHDPELSTIKPTLKTYFIDLCLGMFMMNIGRIRKKFSNTSTPYGEINLNGDELFNDGKEIYDKAIDEFKNGSIPNIIIDHG